jgi:hypothetical protein
MYRRVACAFRGVSAVSILLAGAAGIGCGDAPGVESGAGSAATAAVPVDSLTGGTPISATVSATGPLGSFSPIAVGLNGAAWDSAIADDGTPALLDATGVQTFRYPGGSTSDN